MTQKFPHHDAFEVSACQGNGVSVSCDKQFYQFMSGIKAACILTESVSYAREKLSDSSAEETNVK